LQGKLPIFRQWSKRLCGSESCTGASNAADPAGASEMKFFWQLRTTIALSRDPGGPLALKNSRREIKNEIKHSAALLIFLRRSNRAEGTKNSLP
jgi:hypothetical protein